MQVAILTGRDDLFLAKPAAKKKRKARQCNIWDPFGTQMIDEHGRLLGACLQRKTLEWAHQNLRTEHAQSLKGQDGQAFYEPGVRCRLRLRLVAP